jgi:hypothetical protein
VPGVATATATGTRIAGQTVLAAAASAGDLVLFLADGTGFPTDGGAIQIGTGNNSIIIGYTQRVGNQLFLDEPLPANVPVGTQVLLLQSAGDDDDGCHINARSANSNAWMLLIPALGLLVLRGRRG